MTRDLASQGVVTLCDIGGTGFDQASMLGADVIHPNPTGIAYMQAMLQPLLTA